MEGPGPGVSDACQDPASTGLEGLKGWMQFELNFEQIHIFNEIQRDNPAPCNKRFITAVILRYGRSSSRSMGRPIPTATPQITSNQKNPSRLAR